MEWATATNTDVDCIVEILDIDQVDVMHCLILAHVFATDLFFLIKINHLSANRIRHISKRRINDFLFPQLIRLDIYC